MKPLPIPFLLSSIMAAETDSLIINTVFGMLSPNDIGREYGALYSCMISCWKKHNLLELVAVAGEICSKYKEATHQKKLITQLSLVSDLVNRPDYWKHYLAMSLADIKAAKLKEIGEVMAGNEYKSNQIDEILQQTKAEIDTILASYSLNPERQLSDIMQEHLASLDKQISEQGKRKLKTGLYFEKHVKGFRPGDFIILAGRPKMGKSAFANQIICDLIRQNKRIMYVNNEMDESSVINRMLANIYGVSVSALNEPESMSEYVCKQVIDHAEDFRKLPLELYCFQMKTPTQIVTEAQRLSDAGRPVDMIVLDYLQLFRTGEKFKTMYEEITSLSWQMKMVAADLKLPVLALAQVNRKCEDRPNKRPLPADLRETGALEQDATAVMFIYRDEVYNENSPEPGIAEINVAINRNGTTGNDKYFVDFDHMKIGNLTFTGE